MSGTKFILLALIAGAIGSRSSVAQSDDVTSGASLFAACQGAVRSLNGSYSPDDVLPGQYCMGYIEGLMQGIEGRKAFCPTSFRPSTLTRVYVSFMQKNPKYFDQPKAYGLIASLAATYPCGPDEGK